VVVPRAACWQPLVSSDIAMKDFANASFPPEVISAMDDALVDAVSTLPEPVSAHHVQFVAEAILRTAHSGERDPLVMRRLALMELQLFQG
jgi:hypothetical protein